MGSRRMIQLLAVVGVAVSLVAGAESAAFGKGEVRARLTAPLRLDASPGETITVAWKLHIVAKQGVHWPFNAVGIFVRLRSAAGGAATMALASPDAHPLGRYDARVTVPDGGIGGVEIGIRGSTDVVFPLESDPFAGRAAEPPVAPPGSEAVSGSTFPILLVLVGGLAILSVAAVLGFVARRTRWRTRLPES